MFISTPRFLATVTLALSLVTTGFAHSSSDDGLENRDIFEAYQNAERGSYDNVDKYGARDFTERPPKAFNRRAQEAEFADLLARYQAVRQQTADLRQLHGSRMADETQHAFSSDRRGYRNQKLEFTRDPETFDHLGRALRRRRAAALAGREVEKRLIQRAKVIAAKFARKEERRLAALDEEDRREFLSRRVLRRLVEHTRRLADEEEEQIARERYELDYDSRDLEDEEGVYTRDSDDEEQEARGVEDEEEGTVARNSGEDITEEQARELEELFARAKDFLEQENVQRAAPAVEDLEERGEQEDLASRSPSEAEELVSRDETETVAV